MHYAVLLKIDSTNKIAIDGLIQTLDGKGSDAFLGISTRPNQALECAESSPEEKIIPSSRDRPHSSPLL
jgi:hypothetical protein